MAVIRYRVDDLPSRGLSAFTPIAAATPGGSSGGLQHVYGSPGTTPIPSPAPAAIPPISMSDKTQPSNLAPDVFLPSIYFASARNMHPPVPVRPPNEMPMPATNWRRIPQIAMRTPRMGGRNVIPWPRVFQRWGSVTGGAGG